MSNHIPPAASGYPFSTAQHSWLDCNREGLRLARAGFHLQDDAVRLVEVGRTPTGLGVFLRRRPQAQKLPAAGQDSKEEEGWGVPTLLPAKLRGNLLLLQPQTCFFCQSPLWNSHLPHQPPWLRSPSEFYKSPPPAGHLSGHISPGVCNLQARMPPRDVGLGQMPDNKAGHSCVASACHPAAPQPCQGSWLLQQSCSLVLCFGAFPQGLGPSG